MAVQADLWLDLMADEYFADFIAAGGGAVRFVVGDEVALARIAGGLTERAETAQLTTVRVDLATARLHMLQNVVFAVAAALPWDHLLETRLRALVAGAGHRWVEPGEGKPLAALAEANDIAPHLLRRDLTQALSREIWQDPLLTQDFRHAMIALLEARLTGEDQPLADAISGWLNGTLRNVGQLKASQVGRRIGRQNARTVLMSLCHWLRVCGGHGLLLLIDIRQLHRDRRADGLFYTPAAVMDCYEVLRQLIDDAAQMPGLFVAALADEAFLNDDPKRSLSQYTALQMRIWDDVRPLGGDNPLAPLVRDRGVTVSPAERVALRTAFEALRAGVPNRAAISLLGSVEDAIEKRFEAGLAATLGDAPAPGLIFAGGFGSGKSHLLGYLREAASRRNFVVSTLAVSKETPLSAPLAVFSAALRDTVVPGQADDVMTVALAELRRQPKALAALAAEIGAPDSIFAPVFPAILHLLGRQMDPSLLRRIEGFLAGGAAPGVALRQALSQAGARGMFDLRKTTDSALILQRERFAPLLFRAAGFAGWCVLIDEVELIGRYAPLQRARAYAELARWLGLGAAQPVSGMQVAAAITDDFASQVITARQDDEKLPERLRLKGLPEIADLALAAIRAIEAASVLRAPGDAELQRHAATLRGAYTLAYGWDAPQADIAERRANRTMRHHIRGWITHWDVLRLQGRDAAIEHGDVATNYAESDALDEQATPFDEA